MVKAKIMLDGKHVCSAHLKERVLNISVESVTKLLTSPRFVKFALSLKAASSAGSEGAEEGTKKGLEVKIDSGFVKGIFGK